MLENNDPGLNEGKQDQTGRNGRYTGCDFRRYRDELAERRDW